MVAAFVFVNVQVTISPAATLKFAVRVATLPVEFVSSHAIEVSAQPGLAASTEAYVPGATPAEIVPSSTEMSPAGVPVYEKRVSTADHDLLHDHGRLLAVRERAGHGLAGGDGEGRLAVRNRAGRVGVVAGDRRQVPARLGDSVETC